MDDLVQVELDGQLAVLRLNRPERHNSLVPELLESLLAGIGRVRPGGARAAAEAVAWGVARRWVASDGARSGMHRFLADRSAAASTGP